MKDVDELGDFSANPEKVDAVILNLGQIGETAKKLGKKISAPKSVRCVIFDKCGNGIKTGSLTHEKQIHPIARAGVFLFLRGRRLEKPPIRRMTVPQFEVEMA